MRGGNSVAECLVANENVAGSNPVPRSRHGCYETSLAIV
jgi:hypothetical protein